MDQQECFVRSPLLLNTYDSALLVIDVQEKLVPAIDDHERVVARAKRLIAGAQILNVPVLITEQYPRGLGATLKSIAENLSENARFQVAEKLMFSCRECDRELRVLQANGIVNFVLAGMESHICVAQSAFDLMANGFHVQVCVDAVGSRAAIDHDTALRRLECGGAILTTTEAVLFEWCERAGSPQFKQIAQLVK